MKRKGTLSKEAWALLRHIDSFIFKSLKNPKSRLDPVYMVLAALRGPDSESYDDKMAITIPIRKAALPKCSKYWGYFGEESDKGDSWAAEYRQNIKSYHHFMDHGHSAFKALGLKWGNPNKEEKSDVKK